MRCVLDTTVLIYALSDQNGLSKQCQDILEAAGGDRVELYTTTAVIEGFVYIYSRNVSRSLAVQYARDYLELFILLPSGLGETLAGLQLFSDLKLGSADAMLAASAVSFGADALVSVDRHFAAVPSLTWWTPEQCLQALKN